MKPILDKAAGLFTHPWLALPLRLIIGLSFVYASLYKIADPADFATAIATYNIVPESLTNLMALTLSWVELATGLLLAAGLKTRANALAIAGMLIVFIIAISWALARGLDISCGCFESQSVGKEMNLRTLLFDVAMLAMCCHLYLFDRGFLSCDRLIELDRRKQCPHG